MAILKTPPSLTERFIRMTYAENYELLVLAERSHANSITLDVEDEEIRFPVSEVREFWDDLAPGEYFQIISINFE